MTERDIQQNIIDWFNLNYKNKKAMIVHIPNANPKGLQKIQAINYNREMKKQGRIKGFPDLMVLCQSKVAFFEVKKAKGVLSKEQHECLNELVRIGFHSTVAYGFDALKDKIERFMEENLN